MKWQVCMLTKPQQTSMSLKRKDVEFKHVHRIYTRAAASIKLYNAPDIVRELQQKL